jgi:hypothetical protein
MIRKRIIARKPIKRTTTRKKDGKWAILGLHGGKEGTQWTRGKHLVSKTAGDIRAAKNGIKAQNIQKIAKMSKLNAGDKQTLISEIERL